MAITELRYLLDTNICIYIRQKRPADVLTWFQRLDAGEAAVSVITFGEAVYGAMKSAKPSVHGLKLRHWTAHK